MDALFINSENSRTPKPLILICALTVAWRVKSAMIALTGGTGISWCFIRTCKVKHILSFYSHDYHCRKRKYEQNIQNCYSLCLCLPQIYSNHHATDSIPCFTIL